jgi:hypothetical protein
MIMLDRGLAHARPYLIAEAVRLERLAADLRYMAAGVYPPVAEIDQAPVIDQWTLATRSMVSLVGLGTGHPHLGDGPIRTTEIWAIDTAAGWARTLSRLYVLGEAAGCGRAN